MNEEDEKMYAVKTSEMRGKMNQWRKDYVRDINSYASMHYTDIVVLGSL